MNGDERRNMNDDELTKLQVEAWKMTVQVQQHFNDIEMKIRALAITVLTAVVGAAALAIQEGTTLDVGGAKFHLGAAIFVIGLLAWVLFYFVDQIWYHRLLLGAVEHGEKLEKILFDAGIDGFGLSAAIRAASPYQVSILGWPVGRPIHSPTKLRLFYLGVAGLLIAAIILSQLGGLDADRPST
jgi:hypothetical protein